MLLFFDSNSHYATAQVNQKWAGTVGNFVIGTSSPAAPFGGEGYTVKRLETEWGGSSLGYRILTAYMPGGGPVDTLIVGMHTYIPSHLTDPFYGIKLRNNDGDQCSLTKEENGQITLHRGSYNGTLLGVSEPCLLGSSWHFIEWKLYVDDSNGYSEIRVDGRTVLIVSGVDTKNQASSGLNRLGLTRALNQDQYWANIYACDTNGSDCNDFLGECFVDLRLPTSNGDVNQGAPNTGSSYAAVNDAGSMDGNTTYIESFKKGHMDLFYFPDLMEGPDIRGVALSMTAAATEADGVGLTGVVRIDGEDYPASHEKTHDTSYWTSQGMWVNNPDTGLPWTIDDLRYAQFGHIITTSPSTTTTGPPEGTSTTSTTTTAPPDYWWTDFHEYTTDVAPGDWTERYNTEAAALAVRDAGAYGGKCLEIDSSSGAIYGASWDDVGEVTAVEVLARIMILEDSSVAAARVYLLGSGSAGTENGFVVQLRRVDEQLRAWKYVGGTLILLNSKNMSVSLNTWYWVRTRKVGNKFKAKIWSGSILAEPSGWLFDLVETGAGWSGWVGLGQYDGSYYYDFFSVATNGGTAIGPSTTTTAPPP